MNDFKLLTDFIQGIATQLPVVIASLIGIIVVISRWKDAPGAGIWSLLGFGAAGLLCLLIPVSQMCLRYWLVKDPGHSHDTLAIFGVVNFLWSLIRAASYIFLLAAILAGRPKSA